MVSTNHFANGARLGTLSPAIGLPCPASKPPTAQKAQPVSRRNPPHVLVAEDTATNQLILRSLLENDGCRVDVVSNGAKAVAAVAAGHYDVVLMDIAMPEMDGLEASRRIRALPGPQGLVPIIAITATLDNRQRTLCLAAGMNDCLPKPVRSTSLRTALARTLTPPPIVIEALPPGQDNAPLVCDATLRRLNDEINSHILTTILIAFVDDIESRLGRMTAAAATANFATLAFESHAVSSCSRTFGALRLALLCHAIEHAVGNGAETEALALAATLCPIADETLKAFKQVRLLT